MTLKFLKRNLAFTRREMNNYFVQDILRTHGGFDKLSLEAVVFLHSKFNAGHAVMAMSVYSFMC